jgi:cobalt-zinc-cadmium efflux system outer membrane protein
MNFLVRWSLLLAVPLGAAQACPPLSPDDARALTLEAALQRVAECHPDVRAAARALEAAGADAVTAGQRPNPQLTVGAGGINPAAGGVGSGSLWNKTFDHQLRIDQLIERGGKAERRMAAAEAARDAARADLADARRQARTAVARSYYELAAALARQAELRSSVALNEESRQAMERRVRAGDAAPLDATRFGLDALRVRADLAQSEAEVRGLRLQLATAIGAQSAAADLVPAGPLLAPEPTLHPIDGRPDIVAAQARVRAAEQARDLALAQRTRDVSVGVQLDRYPASASNGSGTGNTVSLSVSVPLFVRHANEGEIARAEADLRTAQEALRRVQLAAEDDLARARAQWEAASERHRLLAEQLVPEAERVAAGAELAYRRGASSVLEVLDARRGLRAAHIDRINAEAERAKAAADLDAVTRPMDLLSTP